MNHKKSALILTCFALSMILTLGAPFISNSIFDILKSYGVDDSAWNYMSYRYEELIPSVRMCGILLSLWGIVQMYEKNKGDSEK